MDSTYLQKYVLSFSSSAPVLLDLSWKFNQKTIVVPKWLPMYHNKALFIDQCLRFDLGRLIDILIRMVLN